MPRGLIRQRSEPLADGPPMPAADPGADPAAGSLEALVKSAAGVLSGAAGDNGIPSPATLPVPGDGNAA